MSRETYCDLVRQKNAVVVGRKMIDGILLVNFFKQYLDSKSPHCITNYYC